MTKKRATVGTAANGNSDANSLAKSDKGSYAWDTAERFLDLIGKDPATTWFRTITPGKGANRSRYGRDLLGFDAAVLEADNNAGASIYFITGEAKKASGKRGGVEDEDVHQCRSVFVEWDDKPIEWQLTAWRELGLPEPTAQVLTGGKSVHTYWALCEPLPPDPWRVLQRRLIEHAGGDTACKNPSRLMRLPGFVYIDKSTGEVTTTDAALIYERNVYYYQDEIEACLPAASIPEVVKPTPKPGLTKHRQSVGYAPRDMQEICDAVAVLPPRSPQTYEEFRNALCGCSAALAEINHPNPDGEAINLMAHLWEHWEWQAAQVLESTTTRNAGSFWAIASQHGYQLKRNPNPTSGVAKAATKHKAKSRNLTHDRKMQCFYKCVAVLSRRQRNTLTRQSRLLKIADDLGIKQFINRKDIAQLVLTEKDNQQGHQYKSLDAAARLAMERPEVHWLIKNLIPHGDMSIIGGRPKVGKTRLAVALVAAILTGDEFIGFGSPEQTCPVLLVTDDQADGDTADMLDSLKIWSHARLKWSPHFRLNETDLDKLLADIKANPGALVVVDSLRSITRSLGCGENDPEMGACLYDLKQSVLEAGGSLVLIHHANKTNDLIGVEALSGHSAIAGAANTILTLHYCPDDSGKPDKQNNQRRLVREARSGKGCDLVLSPNPGTGGFYRAGEFSAWQQQLKDAKAENKREGRMTTTQDQILDLLEERVGAWLTCREVVEGLDLKWDLGRGADSVRVRTALNRLADKEEIQRVRAGTAYTFSGLSKDSQPHPYSKLASTTSITSEALQGNGSQLQCEISTTSTTSTTSPPPPATQTPVEVVEIESQRLDPLRQNRSEVVEVVEAKTVGSGADVSDVDTEELRRRVEKAMAIKRIATSLSQLQEVAELMGYGPDWAPREAQRLGFTKEQP
jgi:predicted transcriptional regulator